MCCRANDTSATIDLELLSPVRTPSFLWHLPFTSWWWYSSRPTGRSLQSSWIPSRFPQRLECVAPDRFLEMRPSCRLNLRTLDMRSNEFTKVIIGVTSVCGEGCWTCIGPRPLLWVCLLQRLQFYGLNSCAPRMTKEPEITIEMNVASSRKQIVPDLIDIFADFETDTECSISRSSGEEDPFEYPKTRTRRRTRRQTSLSSETMCQLTVFTPL